MHERQQNADVEVSGAFEYTKKREKGEGARRIVRKDISSHSDE